MNFDLIGILISIIFAFIASCVFNPERTLIEELDKEFIGSRPENRRRSYRNYADLLL